jgi:hypothetical protein
MGLKPGLILREEHRVRVFENRVLRRLFGPKRDKVTGEWRKLHNEELRILYSCPNIIRNIKSMRMGWVEHVARMGDERNVFKVLIGKPEERHHSEDQGVDERMRSKWILVRLSEGCVEWIHLAEDSERWWAVVNTVMNLLVLEPSS